MPDSVEVYAPGSTSNLGPGFDCLGVALTGAGDRLTARRAARAGVVVARVSDPRVPLEPDRNAAALAARAACRLAGREEVVGIELELDKGLPLSGGLGGSAASAVAGAVAANALLELGLAEIALLRAALEAETIVAGRHADNVAPSLLGGGVLVISLDPLELARVRVHPSIRFVLGTPNYGVDTAQARAVLPESVERTAATAQAAHCGALILGLERGDADLLRVALPADHIALPSRASLYPGLVEAQRAGREAGAWGVTVSGGGPTVVALCDESAAVAVAAALVSAFESAGHIAQSRVAAADAQGARLLKRGAQSTEAS